MNKTCLIIFITFLLGFISCKNETQKIIPSKFERNWYSIDGGLKVYSSHTFEYVSFSCISKSISKGKWAVVNDTLYLNSYPPEGCYFDEEFETKPPTDTINMKPQKITQKGCIPNTGYVNFRNEKFYIKDSLLMSKNAPYNASGEFNYHTNFKMKSYNKQ